MTGNKTSVKIHRVHTYHNAHIRLNSKCTYTQVVQMHLYLYIVLRVKTTSVLVCGCNHTKTKVHTYALLAQYVVYGRPANRNYLGMFHLREHINLQSATVCVAIADSFASTVQPFKTTAPAERNSGILYICSSTLSNMISYCNPLPSHFSRCRLPRHRISRRPSAFRL